MDEFTSLEDPLDRFFGAQLSELPQELRVRVEQDFTPMPWDDLTPGQRRDVARQWDYLHDPAMESDRQFWWDFYQHKRKIESEISDWNAVATPSATDKSLKDSGLREPENELASLKAKERRAQSSPVANNLPEPRPQPMRQGSKERYVPYPKALRLLAERLTATPAEVAMWIFFGPEAGGLSAFLNANELDPPPRFYFSIGCEDEFDYAAPLMACWFASDEIAKFLPSERYITGAALLNRWSGIPGVLAEPYIVAKILESRLIDMHPITGTTQWSEDGTWPAKESAIFCLSHVQTIEEQDGLDVVNQADKEENREGNTVVATYPTEPGPLAIQVASETEKESPASRKVRLQQRYDDERARKPRGALQRTAACEGIARQTLAKILERRTVEVLPSFGSTQKKTP